MLRLGAGGGSSSSSGGVGSSRAAAARWYRYSAESDELHAALRAGSPAALWPLLSPAPPGGPRVAEVRVLSPAGAAAVADALDAARPLLADAAATNNLSSTTTQDVHVAVSRVNEAAQPKSLLLDEVGLGVFSAAISRNVLAPLSLLLFPDVAGGHLDSGHAFSLHRVFPERAGAANASASRHNDVCETSLNVCVRATDLAGSRVAFFGENTDAWLDHAPGKAFVNVCRDQHGVEPATRGSRDTAVLRGFARAFRRAPAETYRERCLPPSITW